MGKELGRGGSGVGDRWGRSWVGHGRSWVGVGEELGSGGAGVW